MRWKATEGSHIVPEVDPIVIRVQTGKNIITKYIYSHILSLPISLFLHSELNEIYPKTLKQNPRARKKS